MKKNALGIDQIYNMGNSFESLGYDIISKDKYQFQAIKEYEIDSDNKGVIELTFKHPILSILQGAGQDTVLSSELASIISGEPKLNKKTLDRRKYSFAERVFKDSIKKENHIDTSMMNQLSRYMGQYSENLLNLTSAETKLIQDHIPIIAELLEAFSTYSKYESDWEETASRLEWEYHYENASKDELKKGYRIDMPEQLFSIEIEKLFPNDKETRKNLWDAKMVVVDKVWTMREHVLKTYDIKGNLINGFSSEKK